jgi:hypothetical protein
MRDNIRNFVMSMFWFLKRRVLIRIRQMITAGCIRRHRLHEELANNEQSRGPNGTAEGTRIHCHHSNSRRLIRLLVIRPSSHKLQFNKLIAADWAHDLVLSLRDIERRPACSSSSRFQVREHHADRLGFRWFDQVMVKTGFRSATPIIVLPPPRQCH